MYLFIPWFNFFFHFLGRLKRELNDDIHSLIKAFTPTFFETEPHLNSGQERHTCFLLMISSVVLVLKTLNRLISLLLDTVFKILSCEDLSPFVFMYHCCIQCFTLAQDQYFLYCCALHSPGL